MLRLTLTARLFFYATKLQWQLFLGGEKKGKEGNITQFLKKNQSNIWKRYLKFMDFIRLFDSFAFKMKAFIKLSLYSWEGGWWKHLMAFRVIKQTVTVPVKHVNVNMLWPNKDTLLTNIIL